MSTNYNNKGFGVAPGRRRATQTWAPNAEIFVQRSGMNPCADNYVNRGASTADLDAQTLKAIHGQILSHVGTDAANNYVCMIRDLPYLSAEAFLTMLYTLEVSSWKWSSSHLINKQEFSSKPYCRSNLMDGVVKRDETEYIKKQFFDQLKKSDEAVKIEKYSW